MPWSSLVLSYNYRVSLKLESLSSHDVMEILHDATETRVQPNKYIKFKKATLAKNIYIPGQKGHLSNWLAR